MKLLEGKTALITGGGSGIGRETARLFAEEGANVVITGRKEENLIEAAGTDNGAISYLVNDVSKEEDCKAAVEFTLDKFGKLDILFNNAGIIYKVETHDTTTEQWETTFDINVRGMFLMSKYAIPHMLEQKYGCIVNNSSILGLKASRGFAAYNASKGAVGQLTKSMALEYAALGIRVNAICPGTIFTPMVDYIFDEWGDREMARQRYLSVHPIKRFGDTSEAARAVLFLCDDRVGFITGVLLPVDGGLSAK